jgi:hypothetical protein
MTYRNKLNKNAKSTGVASLPSALSARTPGPHPLRKEPGPIEGCWVGCKSRRKRLKSLKTAMGIAPEGAGDEVRADEADRRLPVGRRETNARLRRIIFVSEPPCMGSTRMIGFGDTPMCRLQNRDSMRSASLLARRDLDARLAPLDRYGLGGLSSALVLGLIALVGASRSALFPVVTCAGN